MSDRYNVLFLCTGNSARSIMAEAILNSAVGGARFHAFSAGSHPAGKLNPFAIEHIQSVDLATEGLRSKSWDEFAGSNSPKLDFVFTVCDNAAGEVCPIWPGQPMTAHWGVEDPAALEGSDDEKRRIFAKVFNQLINRIRYFTSLPIATIDRLRLQKEIDQIGKMS